MIWPGDHEFLHVRIRAFTPRMIIAEFCGGWVSDIPLCCIIYYLLAMRLYLLLGSQKLLGFLYFDDWDFFERNDYHRCPICHFRNRTVVNRWDGWRGWTFYYYPWENGVSWLKRFHAVWAGFLRRLAMADDRFRLEPKLYPRKLGGHDNTV